MKNSRWSWYLQTALRDACNMLSLPIRYTIEIFFAKKIIDGLANANLSYYTKEVL